MFKRTIGSIYKLYNINNSNVVLYNNAPLKSLLYRSSGQKVNMSTADKIVDYNNVLAAINNTKVYIIDVREPSELLETGKIPNSINIPLAEVENALKSYSDEDFKHKFDRSKPTPETPIIFSCRSGKRAGMALDTALKLGFNNSKSYKGSWLDWEEHTKN